MKENIRIAWLFVLRHRIKVILILANVGFGAAGLYLSLTGGLPFKLGNFIFFSFLVFLVSLYRPIWIFLLFVGMLPYEIVNIAPPEIGISLRPYQWLMILLLGAVGARTLLRRPVVPSLRIRWIDALPPLLVAGAFWSVSSAASPGLALKLSLVLVSLVALLFVVRLFVRTEHAMVSLLPFVLSSFAVVVLWSLIQSILFVYGHSSFEVMAGRPNSTFTEPDWLGMYLLFPIAIALAWLYQIVGRRKSALQMVLPFLILFFGTLVLWISMTRSAWLGFVGMGLFFTVVTVMNFGKRGEWERALRLLIGTGCVVGLSLMAVPVLHLSSFSVFDRMLSTSGREKITVACFEAGRVPAFVGGRADLEQYGCQHIRLEERDEMRAAGYSVEEIERIDPNVSVRQSVYVQSAHLVQEHPWKGIGWGGVGVRLGTDERGTLLNASNMFLEFWLGSGLLGFVAFVFLWFTIGLGSGRRVFPGDGFFESEVVFSLFFHLTWIGFLIFNLFNSGIFLGFFFFFVGLGGVLFHRRA